MKNILFITLLITSCSIKSSNQSDFNVESDTVQLGVTPIVNCDSLKYDYINGIDFPFNGLDSLTEAEIDPGRYLLFNTCDNLIIQNERTDIQTYYYISLQNTIGEYYPILVYRQMDMENCVFIFSIDKGNNVADSEVLFCVGSGYEREKDVLIEGKVTNMLNDEKKAVFGPNTYTSVYREFYSLRDTLSGSEIIEVGRQIIVEYKLDGLGRFKKTREDSFEKEYSKTKYW